MAFNKKTWLARSGLGLSKFSMNGGTPVLFLNKPDEVSQEGDLLSEENLNDLEDRIEAESDSLFLQIQTEAGNRADADTALCNSLKNLFLIRACYITSTSIYYGQEPVDVVDGYTPIGVVGHYLGSTSQYFRGRGLYASGGITYARLYWWNVNQATFSGVAYVLYKKNNI